MANSGLASARSRGDTTSDRNISELPYGLSSPARAAIMGLCVLGVLVAFKDLGRHDDSWASFANALAFIWLAFALAALAKKRTLGLTRSLVFAFVALGILRSIVSLWGVPVGWTVTETIDVRGRVSSSQNHMTDLSFQAGDVPAHLINDTVKFNFRGDREDDPERAKLPVAVSARSYVVGQGTLLISSSSPIRITVGTESTELKPPIEGFRRDVSVPAEEPIEIAMVPTGVDRAALQVRPLGLTVYSEPSEGPLMTIRRLLGQGRVFIDWLTVVGVLLTLVMVVRVRLRTASRQRLLTGGLVGLVVFLVVAPDVATWASQHQSLLVLTGGDDWLTYESFARDIRENSILMLSGKPMGTADAFYYQPLYPYALALEHLLVGESAQGIVLLQLFAVGLVLIFAFLALPSGFSALVSFAVIGLGSGIFREWTLMAGRLLSENLLMIVFSLFLYVMSRLRSAPNRHEMLLVGILLGVACLVRSTSWLATPFILLLLLRSMPVADRRTGLVLLVLPMMLLAVLVPARNIVAAGTPAVLPTSGSINLVIGNVPVGRKVTAEPWVSLSKTYDSRFIAVAEAVVNAPGQVMKRIIDKSVYVLGFPRSMDADNPAIFWPILSLWLLAPLGLLTSTHSRLEWTSLIMALAHVFSLIVFFPNNYFYRLEMPATLPLAIWDAIAVAAVFDGIPDPNRIGRQAKRLLSSLTYAQTDRT